MPSNAGRDGVDPDSRTRRQPRGLPASSMCRSATQARICIYQARLKCSLTNVGPARPSGHRLRECGPFNTGDGRAMGIRAASTRASGIPATEHRLRVTSNAVGTGLRTTWGTDVSCLGSTDTELASAIAQLTYSADSVAQQHVNAITSGSDRFDTSPVDSRTSRGGCVQARSANSCAASSSNSSLRLPSGPATRSTRSAGVVKNKFLANYARTAPFRRSVSTVAH